MPMSAAVRSPVRCALLVAALLSAPALLAAQSRAAVRRVELVMVSTPSVRIRTAPFGTSLSIEEVGKGTVFHVAGDDYQSKDWIGIILDGRIAYVPRYAMVARAFGARSTPVEEMPVTQVGAPAAEQPIATSASAPAEVVASQPRPEPAPRQAMTQGIASAPVAAPSAAPAPASVPMTIAKSEPKSEPAPQMRPSAPSLTETQPSTAPAAQPAKTADAAPAAKQESSRFRVPRPGFGLTVGAFGSVTPIKTAGIPTAMHVAGSSFVGIRLGMLGIYGAPDFGQGAGYKSTMISGGGALHLLNIHPLHVTLLGGLARYSETTVPTDSTVAPVTSSIQGTSLGGIASIPFIGPLRLGYRGQYFVTKEGGVSATMTRHYVGLVF
jgi:hypothetical protein